MGRRGAAAWSGPAAFGSLSVILPVINETRLLERTVEIVEGDCRGDVLEYLLVVCDRTTAESLGVCRRLEEAGQGRVRILKQVRPWLGGAMQDAFDAVRGTHALMMASDMETPPDRVKAFVAEARANPGAIITGSRWIEGGGFEGYSRLKFVLNFLFQKAFSLLYGVRLTDMTYGYRLFPAGLLKAVRWEELRHAFLFETLVKPLRLGVPVREIATAWRAREEGASQNTFLRNFEYFGIGLRVRFGSRKRVLKAG